MAKFSTRQAAKMLGIAMTSLDRYIAANKVPAPEPTRIGNWNVRAWTEEDIERIRDLLPKIANGRKTRHQKKRLAVSVQKSTKPKTKKPRPRPAVPHVPRKRK